MNERDRNPSRAQQQQPGAHGSAARRSTAPGKRPRTMGLPSGSADADPAPVQRRRDPAAAARAEDTDAWMRVAMQPDVYAAPVQRASAG
ncbi:MAG: hypothetical protein AAGC55_33565, partial [Myxococcota bacterium]